MLADAGDAFAALGDRFCHLICVTEAAEVAELRGEYDRAIRMFEEGLAGVEADFSAGVLAIRTRLANLEILRGNLSLAESMHREVLDHWHGSVGQWPQAMSLLGLATIARRREDPADAVVHLDAAWAMGRTQTVPLMRSIALVARGYTADQQGDASSALGLQVAALPVGAGRLRRRRAAPTRSRGWAAGYDRRPRRRGARAAAQLLGRPMPCGAVRAAGMPAARALRRRPLERRARSDALATQAFVRLRAAASGMPTRPRPTR